MNPLPYFQRRPHLPGLLSDAWTLLTRLANDPVMVAEHRRHLRVVERWSDDFDQITGPEGVIEVGYCMDCRLIQLICLHRSNRWKAHRLICDVCGVDGT